MKKQLVYQLGQFRGGIVASVCPKDLTELGWANGFAKNADFLEIRLDNIRLGLDNTAAHIIANMGRPIILAMNPKAPNGKWNSIELQNRWLSWVTLPKELIEAVRDPERQIYVDWGYELIDFTTKEHRRPPFPWERIGASWHDFDGTPSDDDLGAQLLLMQLSRAKAFIKMVPTAKNTGDLSKIQRLLDINEGPTPFIAFGMGEAGIPSRIVCLKWGSAAVYGYVPRFGPTAPTGQLSVVELFHDENVAAGLRILRQYVP